MKVLFLPIRPWISTAILASLLSCATGIPPDTCTVKREMQAFSLVYPFPHLSGRSLHAWEAMCAGKLQKADIILREMVIDSPSPEITILIAVNELMMGRKKAAENLISRVREYESETPAWFYFRAMVMAMNDLHEDAWRSLIRLPASWMSQPGVRDLKKFIRVNGQNLLLELGWDAFILEDETRLASIVNRFPPEWGNDPPYVILSTALDALNSPETFDITRLESMREPYASAIRNWLSDQHISIEDRMTEVTRQLKASPEDETLHCRLYHLKKHWELANLPRMFADAYESPGLTRAQFGLLIAWQFPRIRLENQLLLPVVVDLLDRPESPYILPTLANEYFSFADPQTNRLEPDRFLHAEEVVSTLVNLAEATGYPICGSTWEELKSCGFFPPGWEPENTVTGESCTEILEKIAWNQNGQN